MHFRQHRFSFFLSLDKQDFNGSKTNASITLSDSIPDRGIDYYIQMYGINNVTSIDTIIDFNFDTCIEKITILKNEIPKGSYMYLQYLISQDLMDQKKIKEIQDKYYK